EHRKRSRLPRRAGARAASRGAWRRGPAERPHPLRRARAPTGGSRVVGSAAPQQALDEGVDLAAVAEGDDDHLDALGDDPVDDAEVAGAPGAQTLERELQGLAPLGVERELAAGGLDLRSHRPVELA